MDSFKRVAILLLTGLTMLVLLLGYRIVSDKAVIDSWIHPPRILSISNPCYLVQVRSDSFLISIDFPPPNYINKPVESKVHHSMASYFTTEKPDQTELRDLCTSLQMRILDVDSKQWLQQYNKPKQ